MEIKEQNLFQDNEDHCWIPLADLMTLLMLCFLLIAITFIAKAGQSLQKHAVSAKAGVKLTTDIKLRSKLADDLNNILKSSLMKWHANFDKKNLVIKFDAPEVLFATGKEQVSPAFKKILADFFPQYLTILTQESYINTIREVRVEGYSSNSWLSTTDAEQIYFNNMQLSQARAYNVLKYIFTLPEVKNQQNYIISHFNANGFSFAHSLKDSNGIDNLTASQRVEFRIILESAQGV